MVQPMAECGLGLEGYRVAVTSSSTGIGFGIAKVMGLCGARVVLNGRNRDRLDAASKTLRDMGIDVYTIQADLSREGEAAGFINGAIEALGGLDTLVYVPPPPPGGRFEDVGMDAWRLSYRLLVEAALEAIYTGLNHLRRGRTPSIITITSIAAWEPLPGIATSSVLRPSLHGLTVLLARDLGRYGIRVNAIVPGYINTDRLREVASMRARAKGTTMEEEVNSMAREIPLGRIGEPEDIGWLAAFLASPRASYITGAIIPVTGGRHTSIR